MWFLWSSMTYGFVKAKDLNIALSAWQCDRSDHNLQATSHISNKTCILHRYEVEAFLKNACHGRRLAITTWSNIAPFTQSWYWNQIHQHQTSVITDRKDQLRMHTFCTKLKIKIGTRMRSFLWILTSFLDLKNEFASTQFSSSFFYILKLFYSG